MARRRRKIGEILRHLGLVTDEQVHEALKISEGSRTKKIGEVLVDMGYIGEADVAKALAMQFDMEYIDPDESELVKRENLSLLPQDMIKKHNVLPLSKENGRLKVLIHDPMDLDLLDNLRFRLNCEIDTALGAKGKIQEYIERTLSKTQQSIDQLTRDMSVDASGKSIDVSIDQAGGVVDGTNPDVEDAQQAPIVRLVNHVIQDAVQARASDIHIEPFSNRVRLRFRVDGVCHEQENIPKRTQSAVTARLKIMAGMKVEEKRVPQDGRIKARVGPDVIDFRVSACPTYHGESIVLRILRQDAVMLGLENLGLREDTLTQFNSIIRRPNGILLVTGPTGSGKTTTLYSALNVLNTPNRKIITAEDPVEYNFKGINQCQIHEQIGLTFARVLKAMLRQAPNVILVGEIRDMEVGNVAIQAALTGHLVFSTLHTNDAPSAITRLIDMGIKPFLVASAIQAVLAQRLVRMLCNECKQPDPDPPFKLMQLCGLTREDIQSHTIYKAVGCAKCGKTGYRGRRGIYEMMLMNTELRELAFKRAPVNQVRKAALNAGMRPLLGDGRLKVLDGQTTLEEIARVTQVAGVVDTTEEEDEAA